MNSTKHILIIALKSIVSLVLVALFAVIITSVSLVYDFHKIEPFSGPDIFNPYSQIDSTHCWKRANFHTHTRVEGIFNECEMWPDKVYNELKKFNYDIITFSNHNYITKHPFDTQLQVNLYEHGYNLFKFHKLVFGSQSVNRFDNLVPLFTFQKQFQIDLLSEDSDIVVLNHPLRSRGVSKSQMERLSGYQIIELDSGRSTENEYWDWALSAGRYSFALANDDLHYPDRSGAIAVRCNFLCTPSAKYEDIKTTLLGGCYYSMRVPDYGKGDWQTKIERNKHLPSIKNIGLKDNSVYIALSQVADSIKVIGQNHTTLALATATDSIGYTMKANEPYSRFITYFKDGEVIYSNPFARYNASLSDSPFVSATHSVNILKTIIFNIALLILSAVIVLLLYKTIFVWKFSSRDKQQQSL